MENYSIVSFLKRNNRGQYLIFIFETFLHPVLPLPFKSCKGEFMMNDKSDSNSPESSISYMNTTSILNLLPKEAIKHPARLGLFGSILWLLLIAFYIVNDLAAKPIESYIILGLSDIINIISTLFLLMFVHFLYKQKVHFNLNKLFLIIYIGFVCRLIGKTLEGFNYLLMNFDLIKTNYIDILFLVPDSLNFLGISAYAVLMLILSMKEKQKFYKAICLISFIIGLIYSIDYFTYILLDLTFIKVVYINITRFISILSSITFIIYFSKLLLDSAKQQKSTSSNSFNV